MQNIAVYLYEVSFWRILLIILPVCMWCCLVTGIWYWFWFTEVHIWVGGRRQRPVWGTDWSGGWQAGQYTGCWLGELTNTGQL